MPGSHPLLAAIGKAPALLVPDETTYVAELAPLLAALDDAHVATGSSTRWSGRLPGGPARRARRSTPGSTSRSPASCAIVQRQDGLELVSGIGKLPGPDPNGPTVPVRGGRLDVATTREGLQRMQAPLPRADACLVPSFGTELRAVATVLSAFWGGPEASRSSSTVCLVYPRPGTLSEGAGKTAPVRLSVDSRISRRGTSWPPCSSPPIPLPFPREAASCSRRREHAHHDAGDLHRGAADAVPHGAAVLP